MLPFGELSVDSFPTYSKTTLSTAPTVSAEHEIEFENKNNATEKPGLFPSLLLPI